MASTASVTQGRRARSSRRSWPLATAALGAVALAATTGALGARLMAVWPQTLAASQQWPAPSAAAIESLIAVPLLAVGAVVAAWWGLSLLLITASLLADRAGLHSAALVRCIHAIAPRALRRLAVAGVGAGLAFSTLPAHAAQEPPDMGWTTAQESAASAGPDDAARPAPVDPTTLGALPPPADAVPQDPQQAPPPAEPPAAQPPAAPPTATQPPAVQPPAVQSPADAVRPDLTPGVVVVAPADTLWDLAAAQLPPEATDAQIASSWHAWYALNLSVIGDDPDLLHPGQLLQVPPAD